MKNNYWWAAAAMRAAMLLVFFALFFFSLFKASQLRPTYHIGFSEDWLSLTLIPICLTAAIGVALAFARFTFGYFVGFYLFAMMAGYFWLNAFSTLDYDHPKALIASTVAIVAFLLPVLTIRKPLPRPDLSSTWLDGVPDAVIGFAAALLIYCTLDDPHFDGLNDVETYRAAIERPKLIQYAIGNLTGALIPFSVAYAIMRDRKQIAAALCLISMMYYPVTLTKTSLMAGPFIVFMAILSSRIEPRMASILSLLVPVAIGIASVAGINVHHLDVVRHAIFGILDFRLLAIPSSSLDHYFEFFNHHQLTGFCQISFLKPLMACPYSDQLSVVFAKQYGMGNMNASLFATEGVASVGTTWMPLSALACGFIVAIANRVSSGLPPRFILTSGAMIPITLINIPLSTALLSNGFALLMLLWWLTPITKLEGHFDERSDRPS